MRLATVLRPSLALLALSSIALASAQTPNLGPNVDIFSPTTPAAAMQQKIDAVYATEQHNEFGPARHAFLFLPGDYHSTSPSASTPRSQASATRPTPPTSPATSTPTPASPTTTPPAPSGAHRKPSHLPHRWRHPRTHAVGRLPGRTHAPPAHPRRPRPQPAPRLGLRRLDLRHRSRRHHRLRHPAAMDRPQLRLAPLDRLQLEHGLRRRRAPPRRRLAQPHLHHHRPHPRHPQKAIHRRRRRRPLEPPSSPRSSTTRPASPGAASPPANPTTASPSAASTSRTPAATPPPRSTRSSPPAKTSSSPPASTTSPNPSASPAPTPSSSASALLPCAPPAAPPPSHRRRRRHHHRRPALRRRTAALTRPLQIGPPHSHASHSYDPIALFDVFFRVGGAGIGKTDINLEINSRDTLIDHTWIWRADHGTGVGWDKNLSNTGLLVNADDVTAYGLFVEHHQQFPGPLARQPRPHLLLPVRDPLRPTHAIRLAQHPHHRRLGLLQGRRHRHPARSLGPRHLQRLHLPQRLPRPRHRGPPHTQRPLPRHDHRLSGAQRRHSQRHRQYRRLHQMRLTPHRAEAGRFSRRPGTTTP